MSKKATTTVKLSIQDIAQRLSVHEQTAQMMLDTGIIDGTCERGMWACIEEAFTDYLANRNPVTQEEIRNCSNRVLSSYRTTLHALYEWDLLLAELQATATPAHKQVIWHFQQRMHQLIERTMGTYSMGMQMVDDARQSQTKELPHYKK